MMGGWELGGGVGVVGREERGVKRGIGRKRE